MKDLVFKIEKRCPYCNSHKFTQLKPPSGDKFFLGSCDKENNDIFPTDGIVLDAYICGDCKRFVFEGPELEVKEIPN